MCTSLIYDRIYHDPKTHITNWPYSERDSYLCLIIVLALEYDVMTVKTETMAHIEIIK